MTQVPKTQQGKCKLEVFVKSVKLSYHTVEICSSNKNFPPKYAGVAASLIETAFNVSECLWRANNVKVKCYDDLKRRKELQQAALDNCESMMFLINTACTATHRSDKSCSYWVNMVAEIEAMTRAWRESDYKRFKEQIKSDKNSECSNV